MPRPRSFPAGTADDLEARIEEYFQSRWTKRKITQRNPDGTKLEFEEDFMRPPTMAGLALALNCDRQTLINYRELDEFRPVIARALHRIAEYAEEALYGRETVTGARFSLEVNHRYGREAEQGAGAGFQQTVIAPAPADTMKAIPKWKPEETDHD